jgi:hypothetical protein
LRTGATLTGHDKLRPGAPRQSAAGCGGCAYGLGMPARKLPAAQDAAAARRIALDGLARDADLSELVTELAPLHPRNNTFPGEVFLRLAADALDWCDASRQQPLSLEGIRDRFLLECTFSGRQNHKLQFAVPGRGRAARRRRAGSARGGRLVADRRLLAIRLVRSDRLHPCRRGAGQCACARGMPATGPAPGIPSAIITISARHGRQSVVSDQRAERKPLRGVCGDSDCSP